MNLGELMQWADMNGVLQRDVQFFLNTTYYDDRQDGFDEKDQCFLICLREQRKAAREAFKSGGVLPIGMVYRPEKRNSAMAFVKDKDARAREALRKQEQKDELQRYFGRLARNFGYTLCTDRLPGMDEPVMAMYVSSEGPDFCENLQRHQTRFGKVKWCRCSQKTGNITQFAYKVIGWKYPDAEDDEGEA